MFIILGSKNCTFMEGEIEKCRSSLVEEIISGR